MVYENGMTIEPRYKGKAFPAYLYEPCVIDAALKKEPMPDTEATYLQLPMPDVCLERAIIRGGLNDTADPNLECMVFDPSYRILSEIDLDAETPQNLNKIAKVLSDMDDSYLLTLEAAVEYIKPLSTTTLWELAEHIELFEFYPNVSNAVEYGRHMIMNSGHFQYDAELDEFYDFAGYGNWRLENERGKFLDSGYICYMGDTPLEDLFIEQEGTQNSSMGGMNMT